MSIETRHLCDRCGAVIGGERSVLSGTGRPAAAAIGRGEFDMCGACAAALGEFLKPPAVAGNVEPDTTEADGE